MHGSPQSDERSPRSQASDVLDGLVPRLSLRLPPSGLGAAGSAFVILMMLMGTLAAAQSGPLDTGAPNAGTASSLLWDACHGPTATVRLFEVVAVRVPISYNHWGDFDPHGRMYVLKAELGALLAQVQGRLEDAGYEGLQRFTADPKPGLPPTGAIDTSDLVRPLVIRAHLGDCVVVRLTNLLPEPVGFHVHDVVAPPGQGMALGLDAPDLAMPGEVRDYRMLIPDEPAMEGAHLFHSHADARYHTRHGLFGALVAEPAGSSWLAPDGSPSLSGTEAIIHQPDGPDFREYVLLYHDEAELLDKNRRPLPTVDNFLQYGPGSKAINYRSEPFKNRFTLHQELFAQKQLPGTFDKSLAYSSYTYGDAAVFTPLAYVGDPTKFRLLNAGPGQHHVHHLHGGGDRWRQSPYSDDTQFAAGLVKHNPIIQSVSERIDVQVLGPGESFNAEIEGGAGGVQQSVGDFLLHCHIVEHYLAGMWGVWRVHNTRQPGLAELPDRSGLMAWPVTSAGLLGRNVSGVSLLDEDAVRAWVAAQLPPAGVPDGYDASVWDWTMASTPDGPVALGEPETPFVWPNYESPAPGERPILLFNPLDGRLSYPFLKPHLGKRPPFAPAHGPAPHLGEEVSTARPDGLCPPDARRLSYNIVALPATVRYNAGEDVDAKGEIFLLAEDKAAVLSGQKDARNLVIRANQGDCVDIVLTSQLLPSGPDTRKVNMHTHLVQFDVQASDGVITGFNYEQSVASAQTTGTRLQAPASAGDDHIRVADAGRLRPGTHIGIGLTEADLEIRVIRSISGDLVRLDAPLENAHAQGQRVGTEFVRYRWYADVELGMVYWHDHTDGLQSWRRGLYGGLVVEPAGSQWVSPLRSDPSQTERTPIREGSMADILRKGPKGSYREFVVVIQDRTHCLPKPISCLDLNDLVAPLSPERLLAAFNLKGEIFRARNHTFPLLDEAESPRTPGAPQGPPATDLWRAYPGDPVVVRLLYAGQASTRAVNTFSITGHRFPYEQHNPGSRVVDSVTLGISDQHNLRLECGAGGCLRLPGDYLYYMSQPDLFWRGAWGVFRVHAEKQDDLFPLPGRPKVEPGALPTTGPLRTYDVVAMKTPVTLNARLGLVEPLNIFALAQDEDAILEGRLRPQPLVLRALPGERIDVRLTNRLQEPVSIHASLVASAPGDGYGIPVGRNPNPVVMPGQSRTFHWFADKEVGVSYIRSFGDAANHTKTGLYGALIVEPAGSAFDPPTGPTSVLRLADGRQVSEHTLLYESDDTLFQSGVMPYTVDIHGVATVNYRTEPLNERAGKRVDKPGGAETIGGSSLIHTCQVSSFFCTLPLTGTAIDLRSPLNPLAMSSLGPWGDPETPIVTAIKGQPLVIRALGGSGDQLQVHTVSGHRWNVDPAMAASNQISAITLGQGEAANVWIHEPGPGGLGDYFWGSHREPMTEAGAWGILRVTDCSLARPFIGGASPLCMAESQARTLLAAGGLA
jgi:manganese oxidase